MKNILRTAVCLLLTLASALHGKRCLTEDAYAQKESCIDARNCHTFWGCKIAAKNSKPLRACDLNWVHRNYKLPCCKN